MVALFAILSVTAPASAAEREPWYCKAIKLLDRNCISVRAYAKAFGRAEAERRARICGATDEQIAEAQACFTTK